MNYNGEEDDFLLTLMLSKPTRQQSGKGSIIGVLLFVAFVLFVLCRC